MYALLLSCRNFAPKRRAGASETSCELAKDYTTRVWLSSKFASEQRICFDRENLRRTIPADVQKNMSTRFRMANANRTNLAFAESPLMPRSRQWLPD